MAEATFDFSGIKPLEPMRELKLSLQQHDVIEWVRGGQGNGLIIAVAGSGKTTTLIEALAAMHGQVAFAAFNRRIADEIREKVEQRGTGSMVRVNTFHGFGFAAWRSKYPRVKVDGNKIRELVKTFQFSVKRDVQDAITHETKTVESLEMVPPQEREFVERLVSLVRQAGVGIVCPINSNDAWNGLIAHHALDDLLSNKKPWERDEADMEDLQPMIEEGKRWALRILRESIRMAGELIDFDDQLYMPLLANAPIQQFDWVLIDEAQDSNVTRRALAAAMLRPGGRMLAVGDPAQAIYGFTGADSESLDNIEQQFGCKRMNLTVSYRCPQRVVGVARQWVSHIEPATDAPLGETYTVGYDSFVDSLPLLDREAAESSAVLCRKNAPLVDLAFALIRQRVTCHVEGRDIGASIKALVTRWKTNSLADLSRRLEEYKARETQKWLARGQETRADAIADRCETAHALIDGMTPGSTVNDLVRVIDQMFQDGARAGLTLSSIHKSKGREWETVYWLGRNAYQPSPFARQAWQLLQEKNLCYVAATRAKNTLVEVEINRVRE